MMIDLQRKNIGGKDRKFRLMGGIILVCMGCITKNKFIKVAGCIFLATGIMQKCVFYDVLNIDTYKNAQDKEISLEEKKEF